MVQCARKYFKCLNSYCIPMRHVCNGHWNCPMGQDERKCSNKTCSGRFKCRNSSLCISKDSICDGVMDCIFQDDEAFCDLPVCPSNCTCLLYSISCSNATLKNMSPVGKDVTDHYIYIRISFSAIKMLSKLLKQFTPTIILIIPHNNLQDPCSAKQHIHLAYLDMSHNSIKSLQKCCFSFMSKLHYLLLAFNHIVVLESKCFYKLEQLVLVNLTDNFLFKVSVFAFEGSVIQNIIVDNSKICCLLDDGCSATHSQTTQCKYTLLSSGALAVMMTVSIIGIALGISVIIVQSLNVGNHGGLNYRATIIDMSIGDMLYNARILIICLADITYGTSYFEQEYLWRKSSFCFLSAGLFIVHILISHFAIYILTISRLHITKYPFDSKFVDKNSPKFLLKLIYFVDAISFLISFIIMITYWKVNDHIPNGICILLGNIRESYFPAILSVFTLLVTTISLLLIPLCYYTIHTILKSNELDSIKYMDNRHKIWQLVLPFVNHVYWAATSTALILMIIEKADRHTLLVWSNAVNLSMNTLTNPFAYTHRMLIHKFIRHMKTEGVQNIASEASIPCSQHSTL